MADLICRTLRDGALEGEHASAHTIKDSTVSSFGFNVFAHILSQLSSYILDGKSQSRALVLVAFSRSPSFYMDLLKRTGIDVTSSHKWFHILDCYTDPLGWKDELVELGTGIEFSQEASFIASSCKNVKDVDKLFSKIIDLGKGLIGQEKVRFCAAIDSVDEMLRHASVPSVAGLLSNLHSHGYMFGSNVEMDVFGWWYFFSVSICIFQSIGPFQSRTVLPFEHQGNGKPIQIYDGRKSLMDNKAEAVPVSNSKSQTSEESKGQIIYLRDSDDEMPDSDEDPDDDLDI